MKEVSNCPSGPSVFLSIMQLLVDASDSLIWRMLRFELRKLPFFFLLLSVLESPNLPANPNPSLPPSLPPLAFSTAKQWRLAPQVSHWKSGVIITCSAC